MKMFGKKLNILEKPEYYVLCHDSVFYSGNKKDYIEFIKDSYAKHPKHVELILVKKTESGVSKLVA